MPATGYISSPHLIVWYLHHKFITPRLCNHPSSATARSPSFSLVNKQHVSVMFHKQVKVTPIPTSFEHIYSWNTLYYSYRIRRKHLLSVMVALTVYSYINSTSLCLSKFIVKYIFTNRLQLMSFKLHLSKFIVKTSYCRYKISINNSY